MDQGPLTQGDIFLARLDPAKEKEVGKIRPVVLLNAQFLLDIEPPTLFVCPLSSQSYPEWGALHVEIPPRDNLKTRSYALVEHCRAISIKRIIHPGLGRLTHAEMMLILRRLQTLVGMTKR